jgi:hypothetical protein
MTHRIAVIGTAGRSAADPAPSAREMEFVLARVAEATAAVPAGTETVLVSGGSSGVDHAAVQYFMAHRDECQLVLELPAPWDAARRSYLDSVKDGARLNALHKAFSRGIDVFDSLWQLHCAIEGVDERMGTGGARAARVRVHAGGFRARNTAIAHGSDRMLAFTRARGATPPVGSGTLDTWLQFKGAVRTHYTLTGDTEAAAAEAAQ